MEFKDTNHQKKHKFAQDLSPENLSSPFSWKLNRKNPRIWHTFLDLKYQIFMLTYFQKLDSSADPKRGGIRKLHSTKSRTENREKSNLEAKAQIFTSVLRAKDQ